MKHARGLTMVELLIGLAIGSLVIIGTVFIYNQSRTSYAINETQARLQENARYALAILESDVQLAGNYGYTNNPSELRWAPTDTYAAELTSAFTERGPAAVHTCGSNYAINVIKTIEGTNNAYEVDCAVAAEAGNEVANTDTFTIRRASTEAVAANAGYLQIYTNRKTKKDQQIFVSATAPGSLETDLREIRNLTFRLYYVGADSRGRAGFPTLWRKSLGTGGGAPALQDEEILPGVEDFQVQLGIDTGDRNADGNADEDEDNDGIPDYTNGVVSRWVNPGADILEPPPTGISAQIVAVRVWLRIRADQPETGFTDGRTYTYADIAPYTPPGADANVRRILVSRTFYLRNARIF